MNVHTAPPSSSAEHAQETDHCLTILRCAEGKSASKTWRADGSILQFDAGYEFHFQVVEVANLDAMERLLKWLEKRQDCFLTYGLPASDLAKNLAREGGFSAGKVLRRSRDGTFARERARIIILDLDKLPALRGLTIEQQARKARDLLLPEQCKGVNCVVQISASSGHPNKDGQIGLHVFFVADEAFELQRLADGLRRWSAAEGQAALEKWCTLAGVTFEEAKQRAGGQLVGLDTATLRTVQPVYTCAPFIESGAPADPYAGNRVFRLSDPDWQDFYDTVEVAPLLAPPRERLTTGNFAPAANAADTPAHLLVREFVVEAGVYARGARGIGYGTLERTQWLALPRNMRELGFSAETIWAVWESIYEGDNHAADTREAEIWANKGGAIGVGTFISLVKSAAKEAKRDDVLQALCKVADSARETAEAPRASLMKATDIEPTVIRWLWQGWIARGKIHIIAGQPGAGKTTLAMKMAASVSSGGRWPDGTPAKQGNVVIWTGEDDPSDTLIPRLGASGGNLQHVYFVAPEIIGEREKRVFDPAKDMALLKNAIAKIGGAQLIVVDPIVSATAADSHKNGETRRALQPLVDLAAELDAAVVGITHFTKGSEGRSPIDRVTGSVAFGALARVVMIAARQSDDDQGRPGPRVLMRAKSNIGADDGGFNYDLQLVPLPGRPDIVASVVCWREAIAGNARDVLAVAEELPNKKAAGALQEAKDFLCDLLADGPKPAKECISLSRSAALALATVRRAKDELGIKSVRNEFVGGWNWALPQDAQDAQLFMARKHEHLDHLGGLSGAVAKKWEGDS